MGFSRRLCYYQYQFNVVEFKDDHLYKALESTKDKFSDEDRRISDQTMTLWTNFAKSGSVIASQ